jgi:hypothetical protein
MARMAATYLEVDAAVAQDADRRRDLAALAAARERSMPVILRAEAVVRACGVSQTTGSRRQADLAIRTARAFRSRVEGRDRCRHVEAAGFDWAELGDPYEAARARWREAEALLDQSNGRSTRTVAREPLIAAAEAAFRLGAWPLLRAVAELSRRAMLPLPKQIEASLEGRLEPATPRPRSAGRPGAPARRPIQIERSSSQGAPGAPAPLPDRSRASWQASRPHRAMLSGTISGSASANWKSWPSSPRVGAILRSDGDSISPARQWLSTSATS